MGNLEMLKDWYGCISEFEEIKIDEAKKLLIDIQNETDQEIKYKKRDYLIKGTLHVVYRFIEKNSFSLFNSCVYDISDIINTCNEIWIRLLDNGDLLTASSYSMMDYKIYSELTDKLVYNKYAIRSNTVLDIDNFAEILKKFIVLKNGNYDFDRSKFGEFLKRNYEEIFYESTDDYREIDNIYLLLDGIFQSLNTDDEKCIKLSKTKLNELKYILIHNGIEQLRKDINYVVISDIKDSIINNNHQLEILKLIFDSDIITETEKEILKRRFGLGHYECHTLEQVAVIYDVSKQLISKKESRAIRKLRTSDSMRAMYQL